MISLTIVGATGLIGSERFWEFWGLWEGLWGGLWEGLWEHLLGDLWEDHLYWRTRHRLHLSEVPRHPLRDPLRAPVFLSELRALFPLIVLPLEAPTKDLPGAKWQFIFPLQGPNSIPIVKTFISCYRTTGPRMGFLKGCLKGFWRVLEGF